MDEHKQLQGMLVDMLAWFHNYCSKNGLRYYVLGGTMLGAMRHGGFIPWDDDIDVGMPRDDMNRLEELLKATPDERYVLETPNTENKDYRYAFSKLYDTHTTLIENTGCKLIRGIYVDIFPLDGIGNDLEESRKNYGRIHRLHNLLLARTCGIRSGRSPLKNAAVIMFKCIPNCVVSDKRLLKRLADICSERKWDECSYGGNLVGAWRFREVMPRTVMGTPTLYKFETLMVYGAENADEYLTNLYGNWRELPPVEKRITHHDYIMRDLTRPYKNAKSDKKSDGKV